ncbi:MAG: autotransporter-associated beta strand repeat-containing protein [Kiritimatiellia bacterium]
MKNYFERVKVARAGFSSGRSCSIPLAAALAAVSGQAATLTWDSDATFANGSTDGSGTWNTALLNWNNGAADVAWPNTTADIAVFGAGGTAGTVTVAGTVNVGTIRFNGGVTGGYLLTGGLLNGLGTISLGQGGVTSGTIESNITRAGALGLSSGTAASTLTLSGALNVTSITLSNLSIFTFAGTAANTTGNITIDSGGSGNVSTLILNKTPGVNAISGDVSMGHYGGSGRSSLPPAIRSRTRRRSASTRAASTGITRRSASRATTRPSAGCRGTNTRGANTVQNGGATDSVLVLSGNGLSKTATNGGANGSFTIQNGSTGKLSIVKNGTGTQVFQNGNTFNATYTGTTTINAGILSLVGLNFNSSPTVLAGGTLNIQGIHLQRLHHRRHRRGDRHRRQQQQLQTS